MKKLFKVLWHTIAALVLVAALIVLGVACVDYVEALGEFRYDKVG